MRHLPCFSFFFFNDTATTEIYTLSLHDALPISAPGESRAVLSLILLVTAETELGKFRLSFLYPYPGHRLAVRPVGHIAHPAADPGIESARDVCPRHRLAVHPVRPVGHIAHLAAEPGIESARDRCHHRRRQPHR